MSWGTIGFTQVSDEKGLNQSLHGRGSGSHGRAAAVREE